MQTIMANDPPGDTVDLVVTVSEIKSEQGGQLIIALFQGSDTWLTPDGDVASFVTPVTDQSEVQTTFHGLPLDQEFAISVVHDKNSNNKMDFRWLPPGPAEGIGVSNNTMRMGPPEFQPAVINMQGSPTFITIPLQY